MNRHHWAALGILVVAAFQAAPAQSCTSQANVIAIRKQALELGAAPVSVTLPIQSARAIPADAMVALTLDDVRAPESTGFFYEVYLDLPANGPRDTSSPSYVGNLGFYGGGSKQQFRVTEHMARALKAKHDKVTLTFVPRGMNDSVPADARVHIGKISITE